MPADAFAGQCPSCLLGLGVADETAHESRAADRLPIQPRDRHFGDYRLGRQLGSGGMGIVYEAHQTSLNRTVALKFIRDSQLASPTLLRRFTIEAEATARLHHPNIVGIHEIGEIDGQPYFSMDLVEGESLRTLIAKGEFRVHAADGSKSGGRARQVTVARLIAKTARALHHAHEQGVLHRDIKPGNILLDRSGEPRLTDFGLAKILRQTTDTDTRQSLTGSGDIAGTPGYMSPEQASSDDITATSDVYSLGVVLYEMLTDQPPFRAATPLETLDLVRAAQPKSPRSLNPLIDRNLEFICLQCLEKDPHRRYASAEALAEDLENWIAYKPIKARRSGPVIRSVQWMKRNRTGTALIAVLLLSLSTTLSLLEVAKMQTARADKMRAKEELRRWSDFDDKVTGLQASWDDPNITALPISSADLAALSGRDPVKPGASEVSLAVTVRGDIINFVTAFAPVAGRLEKKMMAARQKPFRVKLVIVKHRAPIADLLATGKVDFALLKATEFVQARAEAPDIRPIARLPGATTAALIVKSDSPIESLEQLRGRLLFVPELDGLTALATKAYLVTNDFSRGDVRLGPVNPPVGKRVTNRGVTAAVLSGPGTDAGVAFLRRYKLEKHNGLRLLASFPIPHCILAGRPGLGDQVVSALQAAFYAEKVNHSSHEHSDELDWEESPDFGLVPVDEAYLAMVQQMMRDAARFDGEPDPFSASLTPAARAR